MSHDPSEISLIGFAARESFLIIISVKYLNKNKKIYFKHNVTSFIYRHFRFILRQESMLTAQDLFVTTKATINMNVAAALPR